MSPDKRITAIAHPGLRKKKKKSHSTSERAVIEAEISQREKEVEIAEIGKTSESAAAAASSGSGGGGRKMTEAERRFEETQRKRVSDLPNRSRPKTDGRFRERKERRITLKYRTRIGCRSSTRSLTG
jgi:hypothetical protein